LYCQSRQENKPEMESQGGKTFPLMCYVNAGHCWSFRFLAISPLLVVAGSSFPNRRRRKGIKWFDRKLSGWLFSASFIFGAIGVGSIDWKEFGNRSL